MALTAIEQAIVDSTGQAFRVEGQAAIGGGCINDAKRLEGCGQQYFVKLNGAECLPMFEAEAAGLAAIAASGTIRVPRPMAGTGTITSAEQNRTITGQGIGSIFSPTAVCGHS